MIPVTVRFSGVLLVSMVLVPALSLGRTPQSPHVRPRVLLLGDSNMHGFFGRKLGQSLNSAGFDVRRRARPGSGLAFPRFWDWEGLAPTLAQEHEADVVILILGGNDGQSMKPASSDFWRGKIHWEERQRWSETYRQRVRRLAETVTAQGRRFVLMSPTNRRPRKARERMQRILALQREAMAHVPNAWWIDTWSLTSDVDGHYLAAGYDRFGRWVRYRKRDGIHLTEAGASLLRDRVLPLLFDTALRGFPNVTSTGADRASYGL